MFKIQACDSIMSAYFCIGFINSMFVGKNLTDFMNLFPSNNFKKNNKVILNHFLN